MNFDQEKNKVNGPINAGGHVIVGDGNVISIGSHSEPVDVLITKAKNLLINKRYKPAEEIINSLLSKVYDDGDLYYFLSLTILAGRRPKTLGPKQAEEIIKSIDMAIQCDQSKSNYLYFKAIMLYDFYFLNGYSVDINVINELLTRAANAKLVKAEIEEMLIHMPGTDKEILDCIIYE